LIVTNAGLARLLGRPVQRRTEQAYLHEIVEVAGLQ